MIQQLRQSSFEQHIESLKEFFDTLTYGQLNCAEDPCTITYNKQQDYYLLQNVYRRQNKLLSMGSCSELSDITWRHIDQHHYPSVRTVWQCTGQDGSPATTLRDFSSPGSSHEFLLISPKVITTSWQKLTSSMAIGALLRKHQRHLWIADPSYHKIMPFIGSDYQVQGMVKGSHNFTRSRHATLEDKQGIPISHDRRGRLWFLFYMSKYKSLCLSYIDGYDYDKDSYTMTCYPLDSQELIECLEGSLALQSFVRKLQNKLP